MNKKSVSILFSSVVFTALLIGVGLYFVLEQRPSSNSQELTTIPEVSLQSYLSGSFQEKFEQALKDQFALHDQAIEFSAATKAYIRGSSNAVQNLLAAKKITDGLMPFGNVYRMNGTDWLTNMPYRYNESDVENYKKKAGEINQFAARHPNAHIYVYYCTRAEDVDWFNESEGIQSYSYATLLKSLLDTQIGFDSLKFRDFNEFSQLMYKTDHHWNNLGASRGYSDILRMMGKDFLLGQARSVLYTENFGNLLWQGSRSRESAVSISDNGLDHFAVDRYVLETHKNWYGDKEQTIGLQEAYADGEINRELGFDQYLNYYGFESQVVRLKYENSTNNLLIIGDSFTRALREQLSSHFGTTVYVNFRILPQVSLDELMKQYDINAVLFMGQQDAWSGYFLNGGKTE